MPSSPSSAGTPEAEKSQQPRPSAIMESILTLMGSDRARPRATSRSTPSSSVAQPLVCVLPRGAGGAAEPPLLAPPQLVGEPALVAEEHHVRAREAPAR